MQLPPNAIKLNFWEFISARSGSQRIITTSGYQYEEANKLFEYHCAICRFVQAAPVCEGVDYECPRCKWRYKIYGNMLAVWNPEVLGVSTPALAPGEEPPENVLDQAVSDPQEAAAARERSTAEWAGGKNEDWGKTTQVTVPKGESSEDASGE